MPCTLHAEGSKLADLKASSLRTNFLSTRRCYRSCQGRRVASILPSCSTHETQQWPAWQGVPNGAIAALIFLFTQGSSKQSVFCSLHSVGRILKSVHNIPSYGNTFTQPAAEWPVSCCYSQQIPVFQALERRCKVRQRVGKNRLFSGAQWALYSVFPMPCLSRHALDSEAVVTSPYLGPWGLVGLVITNGFMRR